jgi:hypothetical protein
MKGRKRNLWILVPIAILSAFLISTTALAQTDININNRNLFRIGGDITVASDRVVDNALAVGGDVTVQPRGRVTQTAIAIGGDVVLQENARVDGDAYAVGGKIIQAQGATIGGAADTFPRNERGDMYDRGRWGYGFMHFFNVAFYLLTVLISAAIGVLLLLWQPNFLPTLAATINQYPGRTGLWGLGGFIVMILLDIFLAVSLLGIPLIPLVNAIVVATAWLGSLGVVFLVGQRIFATPERTPIQQFLIGLLVVGLIGLIPMLGGLVLLVANIFGLGAILAWKLGNVQPQLAR